MSTSRRVRTLLLLAVIGAALTAGVVSFRSVGEQLSVLEACEASGRADWNAALSGTEGRVGADETGRAAAECRCLALLATNRGAECVALLEQLLADPDADGWAPNPTLAVHLIQTWRDQGRTLDAAELARRAAQSHPENADLFYLELVTRSVHEDEPTVIEELFRRLPASGPGAARMRISLANRHLQRGAPERALQALGDTPPPGAVEALGSWYETRGMAYATAGNLAGLERSYARWRESGGASDELRARFALTLSIAGLQHPSGATVELLHAALEAGQPFADARLEEALTVRLILSRVVDGHLDEALAAYDRARERFALAGLSRDELLRSAAQRLLAREPGAVRRGTLRFSVHGAEPGAQLLLSPDPTSPVDSDFETHPLSPSGELRVERRPGMAPQRWVYRDARGDVRASGTVSPVAGRMLDIEVQPRAPRAPLRATLSRRPADGRRRVALLLLDCADWHIVQYLRARGELPVLSALIDSGHRAVLDSDPPLTASAMEALVWPRRRSQASFVGLLHQLGVELGGLASVGDNPLGALAWLLPEDRDLFATLGADQLATANLLFAHGGIQAGRHSEVTGPNGRRRRIRLATSARDLDAAERERWPTLAAVREERDAIHLRTIAAEFDAAEQIVRAGEVDLLALRIEPLDILTHAHFAAAVRDGQDDGRGLLFSVYRYIDARLGAVHDLLDGDDVLIAMSDHGIRTAMEHSRQAIFVAAGPEVPSGRAAGTPELRGVARTLADLLGVATDWPDTGVATWAGRRAPLADAAAKPEAALAIR